MTVTWLTGMLRSGTSWFAQIFASHPDICLKLCPLFSYEFKNALDENSSAADWYNLFANVYDTREEYLDQTYLRREGLGPAFPERNAEPSNLVIKSTRFHHLTARMLEKCPEIRFVGIIPHPCAAIHSWLTNPLEFPTGVDAAREWHSGACRKNGVGEFWGFDDWKRTSNLFLQFAEHHPDRFCIARYEAFVRDPQLQVRQLFDWLGMDFHPQTASFLASSQSRSDSLPRSVFKSPSISERWRGELDSAIAEAIEADLRGTPLATFLEDIDA